MVKALYRATCALLLSTLLVAPEKAWAWGNSGHESVAYIAWQQMTPAAQARAIALIMQVPTLHSPDNTKSVPGYTEWMQDLQTFFPGLTPDEQNLYLFMRAATWADSIKGTKFLTDSNTPPPGITTDVNIGFTDTASHGYWHFIDSGFASDNSTVPPTPVPNAATQIVALRQALASDEPDPLKAYDMIWLEHLVGDIHQPLHGSDRYFAGAADVGGNLVNISLSASMKKKFEGTLSKSAPTELHAFWDDLPGEGQPATALSQAIGFAQGVPMIASGAAAANTDPMVWAAESLALAEKDVYIRPIGKGPKPSPPQTGNSYMITTGYYNASVKIAQSRIALAGARLATLLNAALQ